MNSTTSPGGTGGGPHLPSHAPMSERQQLALIKRLELAATASTGHPHDSLLVSPPRAPLQVVNGPMGTPSTPATLQSRFSDDFSDLQRLHTPAIDRLIKKISKRNSKGETPLHTAAIRGSSKLVRQLLVMGADPNAQDNAEWSPLHEACNRGNRSVVKVLLEFGADLNLKGFAKDSPLHDAARNGHIKVVKFLIKSGADIYARNGSGRTPREEAEATLERVDNPDLGIAIKLLSEEESRRMSKSRIDDEPRISLDASDDDESEAEDPDEPENDVAKFLGVAKSSPDVQKAFKSLGLVNPSKSRSRTTPRKQKSELAKSEKFNSNQFTKVRLNFETDINSDTGRSDSKTETPCTTQTKELDGEFNQIPGYHPEPDCDDAKKRRMSTTEEENRWRKKKRRRREGDAETDDQLLPAEPVNPMITIDASGRQVLKVPPLKIILSANEIDNRVSSEQPASEDLLLHEEQVDTNLRANEWMMPSSEDEPVPLNFSSQPDHPDDKHIPNANDIWQAPVKPDEPTRPVQYQHLKKRKLALFANSSSDVTSPEQGTSSLSAGPPNDIDKFLHLRRQIEQRRKNIFPVMPKPPEGFKDYLMNRRTYLLHDNAQERLRSIPKLEPPPSLDGTLKELFEGQENERYKLRVKQLVEKEKLVLAIEQEILRVHGQAARALANQPTPFSFCTILKDDEIYNPIVENQSEDKTRDSRSRFNGRIFLSWLQDVDDKWEKIKEQMLLRHHNEAEALNAVQKMDWEWTLDAEGKDSFPIDDLHIPMVYVSEDFCCDLDRG